jgi:phenylacetate-CoA ligase
METAYAWALEHAILPVADAITQQKLLSRLRYLEEAQWWPRQKILEEQSRALAETVRIAAAEIPYYQRRFAENGVHWRDVRTAADLPRLSIADKYSLREAYPAGLTRKTGFPTAEESSSGTMGEPFRVLEDSVTAGFRRASFLLSLQWAGWRAGERHMQTGVMADRSRTRWWKDKLLRCSYEPVIDLDDRNLDRMLHRLDHSRIRHLWGYPLGLWALAERARHRGWSGVLRSVVTWGDNLYPHYRQAIESTFGVRVYDTYGCSEGMQIAAQCGHGPWYHIHDLDTIVELVDEEGRSVPDGVPGRVLLTRLHAGATPLLRYAVGDVAVRSPNRRCPCGRDLALLERIDGRETDFVIGANGSRFSGHFFSVVVEGFSEIIRYQVRQTHRNGVVIRIVTRQEVPGIESAISRRLIESGLRGLRIEVERVQRIQDPVPGKRRFVISGIHSEPTESVKFRHLTADLP